ncbi:MAG: BatD family protein [Nibricoccus sp.]
MRLHQTFITFVFVAAATLARGQSARWEPSSGTLAFGQTSQLQLVFEGCAPKGQPTIPAVDGLSLQFAGSSSQTQIVNNNVSRTEILAYAARPTKRANITIPELSVDTDKGRVTVSSASFGVGAATVGNGVSLESIATSSFKVPETVWSGEVFPVDYELNVRRRNIYSLEGLLGSLLDWKPAPLIAEEWSKPAARETQIKGEDYITVYQKTRASIAKPGSVVLPEGNQLINITTGTAGLGFFARQNIEQFAITSNRPTINVRHLPANAPAAFNGAVGQFTLKSNIVPATTNVGEPITWTLTLSGTGNWPDFPGLPARSVSKDFRTVQPQAHRTPKDGSLYEATLVEDVVLIPTKPGSYTLGPTTWSYFDPAKGEYQTITTTPITVTVLSQPESNKPAAQAPAQTNLSANTGAKPPALPKGIPRDPLFDSGEVMAPLPWNTFIALLCAPVGLFLIFWLWLAFRRARATDPFLARRQARARLATTLEILRTNKDPAQVSALLLAWQRDTAVLWDFTAAVPASENFPENESSWQTLWSETDRALYREATPLPADWVNRAEQALESKRVASFSFSQLFRLRNLFPFAAILVLTLVLPTAALHAADARSAYDRGDFSTAESAWRSALVQTPDNPSTHHNLSLTLVQQDRWGEAAAHAAAAFAQNPADAAIRWNLAFTMERAGFAPSVFSGFAASHPPHHIAGWLSVTQWQFAAIAAALLAGFGAALLLIRFYGYRRTWLKVTAIILFSLSGVIGGLSVFSLRVYSPLHDSRAAIVWRATTLRSIPTEAETSQKTTALSAGTVAIVDRNFIGKTWAHLSFANGQTGWIRSEDLVQIWQ